MIWWSEGGAASTPHIAAGISLAAAYLTASAIYNTLFHPLRHVPGPALCAISWLPWYKYWFSGHTHHEILRLHEKYGAVVRVGPSEVSFIDTAAWKDIYSLKRSQQIERCPKSFPALTPNGAKYDLLTCSPSDHAKYRKILSPSFNEKATKEYEPAIHQDADKMIARLSETVRDGNPRANITQWLQWLTFDMVGHVVFGESFDCVTSGRSHPCLALSMDLVSYSSGIVFVAWWTALKNFLIKLSGVESLFINMVRFKCQRALDLMSEKSSIFGNLTKAGDPLNIPELDGNLTALIIAGSETTGFAMTATCFYLAKHPDYFKKAKAEVRTAFQSVEDINDDALKKLPYLRAIIEEALRMTPAEPNGLARKVVTEGVDIMGHFIPRGTGIYVSQFAANHHSTHFHLPNEYRPERWLNDPEFAGDRLDAVQPFLMGVNVCIGRSLAWMEMRIIMAKMLWHFDWTMGESDGDAFEKSKAYHVWVKSQLPITMSQRCE